MSPLLRGVEIGLAHGFLLVGPFIKLGPLRNVEVRAKRSIDQWPGGRLHAWVHAAGNAAVAHDRVLEPESLGSTCMQAVCRFPPPKAICFWQLPALHGQRGSARSNCLKKPAIDTVLANLLGCPTQNVAEIVGCINGAATVLILTLCLAAYGAVTFQGEGPQVGGVWLIMLSPPGAAACSAQLWLLLCWLCLLLCWMCMCCGCDCLLQPVAPCQLGMLLTSPLADLAVVQVGVKTLSGRSIPRDPLQSAEVRAGRRPCCFACCASATVLLHCRRALLECCLQTV